MLDLPLRDGDGIRLFMRRLHELSGIDSDDRETIAGSVVAVRANPAQVDIMREGEAASHVHVLLEGIGCRYKIVDGGRRQIVSFLVPGDLCDPHALLMETVDHSVLGLSDTKVALIAKETVRSFLYSRARITKAFLAMVLVGESISREWLANMGRRSPDRRIGHLLCEMLTRLRAVGLADGDRFAFPVTQADLGDTMGLSTVHVNRTLQDLKEKKLIAARRGLFEVLDFARLQAFSDFDPTYLHAYPAR